MQQRRFDRNPGWARPDPGTGLQRRRSRALPGLAGFALLCLCGCESHTPREFHGYLYFGVGNYLARLSLATGNTIPTTNVGDRYIDHVSPLDNGEFLLSVSASGPGRDRFRILRAHAARLNAQPFLAGRQAHYLRDGNTIVYDDGNALVAVPRRNVRSNTSILQSHTGPEPARFVAIDGRGVLFRSSNGIIRYFNAETGRSRPLHRLSSVCSLDDALWLSGPARLLCRAAGKGDALRPYRLATLDGRIDGTLPLPAERRFRAVAYVADQAVLILNETRIPWYSKRERYPVWACDPETGKLYPIAANQYLGTSAVYRRAAR